MKISKFLRKIFILGTVALALTSCQNNISKIEDETPHLVISSSARTAKPLFDMQSFDTIILTGTYNSEDYELGEWTTDNSNSAYANLSDAYIALPFTGEWNFTLDAIKTGETETETDADENETVIENRTLFSDSQSITVGDGANPISFTLNVVEYDTTGTGSIFVTLRLEDVTSSDVSDYEVTATLAPLSNQSSTTEYEVSLSSDSDESYASLYVDDISSGIYLATFNVSKGSYSNVATKRTIITVTNGTTSYIESEFSITASNISSAINASGYTISYNTNGGSWENSDYVTSYNAYGKDDIELPTSDDITRSGYTFEGWYVSGDSSQTIITEIAKGTRGNITLEAKWQNESLAKYVPVSNVAYSAGSLSWSSVDGATSYYVYRTSDSTGNNLTQIAQTTDTSYSIVPYFLEGYYYGVRADSATSDENTTDFDDAIKLSHIMATANPAGGIDITLTLEADETLPDWSRVRETNSKIYIEIGASYNTVCNTLNTNKVYTYAYPYTKSGETYNFRFEVNDNNKTRYETSATAAADSSVYVDTSDLINATVNISYDYLNQTVTESLDLTEEQFNAAFPLSSLYWKESRFYFYYGNTSWNPSYQIGIISQDFSSWTNSITYTVSPTVNFSDYNYQYFGWHDFSWSLSSNPVLIWGFRTDSVTFDYLNSEIATEVVGTWKDDSRMFNFSASGVYYGYTINSGKYSYTKGTYSTSDDCIVIAVEYEGIKEYDEEQTLSDISWKKLSETEYVEYPYTYDSSGQLNLTGNFTSNVELSWENTSNDYYSFVEQFGTTWTSNNQSISNSTAKSTWTIEVPSGVGSVSYSFDYSVSSESGYDKLTITLDGTTVVDGISGSVSGSKTTTLSEGTHTLTATYSKDSSVNNNYDCGTITLDTETVVVTGKTNISLTKI